MKNSGLALAIGMAVNIIDGFDIVAAALTGPLIATAWHIPPAELGLLFSGLPIGLVIGALLLSSLSDRLGRRWMLVTSLVLMSIGMTISAGTGSMSQLFAARILTGIGVGGAIPIVNMLGAEHAPSSRSTLWVSLIALGVPLGQTIGAGVAIMLLPSFGWRSIYGVGALGSILIMVAVAFAFRRLASGALAGAGTTGSAPTRRVRPGWDVWQPYATNIGLIAVVFVCVNVASYFLISWTPKVLVELGYTVAQSARGSMLLTLGGISGSLLVGLLSNRIAIQRLGPTVMILAFVVASTVATISPTAGYFLLLPFLVGLGMSGSNTAMYASIPAIFPAHVRGMASGIAFGVGRLGAIGGPFAAGLLIENGLSRFNYTVIMTAPFVLGGLLLSIVMRRARD